ncbi:hypothetical protein C8F01DRAFT_1379881 [Mycena amicta]|nr:hypothetical protein C8F01DRAFT_1379881 [Mycena amicta]
MTDEDLDTHIPGIGSFAVLTIDAVASVEYLDDAEAQRAPSLFAKTTLFILGGTLFSHRAAFREEQPSLVMRGTPQDVPERCIEASMSIPIFPQSCSISDHPSGREPLRTTGIQFPWTDCYVTTFVFVTVRCANIRAVDPVICELSPEEGSRYNWFTIEDADRQADLLDERAEMEDADALGSTGSTHAVDETAAAAQSVAADINGDSESIAEQVLDNDDMVAIFRGLLASEVEETLITVTFTHNILRVKEFNDARGYYDEVDKIAEIVKASEARKEAAKLAAAQNDATRYDEKTGEPPLIFNAGIQSHAYPAELLHGHQAFPAQEAHPNSSEDEKTVEATPDTAEDTVPAPSRPNAVSQMVKRGVDVCKMSLRRILCISSQSHDT